MSSPFLSTRAPLLWVLAPFMAGLVAARNLPLPAVGIAPVLAVAAGAALAATWAARAERRKLWMLAICLATALAGYALLTLRHPRPQPHEQRPPREVTITLEVNTHYGAGPGGRSLAGLGRVTGAGELERELVGELIYFSAIRRVSVAPRVGAEVEIRGVIESLPRAPTGFDDYLANLGIRHRLGRAQVVRELTAPDPVARSIAAARERLNRILGLGLEHHPDVAALYRAMLLGEKAALRPEQEDAFMRSGTFHVFSVSGLHVGVIAGALRLLATVIRLRTRTAAGVTLALLWLYVLITGAGAPSVRAFVMIAFVLASGCFRLPGNAFAALVASALLLLLLEPLQLFSTGFQMSYTVVAALLLLGAPLAQRGLERWRPFALRPRPEWRWWHEATDWIGRVVITSTAGCWAAFLASIPAGIGYFGVLSPGSLPANLLVLPLSSAALVAGFVSLLVGLAGVHPWSALFNAAAALLILATETLLTRATALPGVWFAAAFRADWLPAASMAAFVAVLVAGAAGDWTARRGGFWTPVLFVALLLIFGVKFGSG
jgi:competence protein ComEC